MGCEFSLGLDSGSDVSYIVGSIQARGSVFADR